ncbi:MAG: tRNA glutamyl-Q(34) synthetase GluQRS [Methyloligellaceae bacterium]
MTTPPATPPSAVFRFAPSPNGALHLGHALSALITYERAKAAGGRFLLRIEDIDTARCHPEHEAQMLEDLAWLGLEWEEPVRRQSEHFQDYVAAADRLRAMDILYPCFASRREIGEAAHRRGPDHPRDPDGVPLYPGLCRDLDRQEAAARIARGEPHAWRIHMERALAALGEQGARGLSFTELDPHGQARRIEAEPERWGDAVIVRKDVPASYHLAVVVDDALQGVTHVTRGEDLFAATHLHRLLQALLGLPAPRYSHHPLLLDPQGRKLSKSQGAPGIAALRQAGHTPEAVREMAFAHLAGGGRKR